MSSLRRFRTLIAIAEQGNFSDAARAVYLTPAAVSQQMKALEAELGVELFDRSRRPPGLNPAGYALIPKARERVRIYDSIRDSVSDEIAISENLTIGTVPTTMSAMMPRALGAMQQERDDLHVRLYPGLSEELYTQVDRGFLDAAVLTEPPEIARHLVWQPFARQPLVLLVDTDSGDSNPRDILRERPYIRFARRAWVGRKIDRWLSTNRIDVNERMELDTLEAVSAMVANGLGVSIVPLNLAPPPGLAVLPLDPDRLFRTLGVLSRRDTAKHRLIDWLRSELGEIAREAGQGTEDS